MPSAVVDTTVLISGFLTPEGTAGKILEQAAAGAFTVCVAWEIIEELRSRLLHRRKIRKSYRYDDAGVHRQCSDLETIARLITGLPDVRVVARDPNDDVVIACALAARADYIVTRDKDLLSLGAHQGVRMVTPRQFLDLLDERS